jgi:drug/metabolite transporter (DMT)-like permease
VLFFSKLTGALVWFGLRAVELVQPDLLPAGLRKDLLTAFQHLQLALESAIVALAWVFTYFRLKHLPLLLGSPIRATSPLWMLFGAVLILGEPLTWLEALGVLTTITASIRLSFAGRREGVHFHMDRCVWFLIAGTMLGAASSPSTNICRAAPVSPC